MGLLTDLLQGYATGVRHHTGLHYVPSFNDLNSGANDDMEHEELHASGMMGTRASEAHVMAPSPPASPGAGFMAPPSQGMMGRSMTNKKDDSPALDPFPDIHKVSRQPSARHYPYDKARSPHEPGIWQLIANSQEHAAKSPSSK